MGRTAVGTTRTFRKRNGGSQENDIRITGNSLTWSLSWVQQLLFLNHWYQLKLTDLVLHKDRVEWGNLDRRSITQRAENSFYVSIVLLSGRYGFSFTAQLFGVLQVWEPSLSPTNSSGSLFKGGFLLPLQLQTYNCSFPQRMAL